MRLVSVRFGFLLIFSFLCSTIGLAQAAGDDWLSGHWDGHDTKNLNDKRHFALEVAGVKSDQSFVAQWTIDDKVSRGQGKVDNNAVTITFPNGNIVSLFHASDGSLAGSTTPKDGTPGINLVFAKGGTGAAAAPGPAPAAAAAGSGQTCKYNQLVTKGHGPIVQAKDGDVVVTREGERKCVNGRLMPVN
jgi:hypothetical protein